MRKQSLARQVSDIDFEVGTSAEDSPRLFLLTALMLVHESAVERLAICGRSGVHFFISGRPSLHPGRSHMPTLENGHVVKVPILRYHNLHRPAASTKGSLEDDTFVFSSLLSDQSSTAFAMYIPVG